MFTNKGKFINGNCLSNNQKVCHTGTVRLQNMRTMQSPQTSSPVPPTLFPHLPSSLGNLRQGQLARSKAHTHTHTHTHRHAEKACTHRHAEKACTHRHAEKACTHRHAEKACTHRHAEKACTHRHAEKACTHRHAEKACITYAHLAKATAHTLCKRARPVPSVDLTAAG